MSEIIYQEENFNSIKEKIVLGLERLGIKNGDNILVHSSLKSFGIKGLSPKCVCDALISAIGQNGTLILPTLTFAEVYKTKVFDYKATPSCVGVISEFFRSNYQQAIRSMHPTHSTCSIGKLAKWFSEGQEKDDTPCGENSAFRKLPKVKGKIIFLGCSSKPNTSMHAIEELVRPPFLFGNKVEYTIIDKNQNVFKQSVFRHNFACTNFGQRYDRVKDLMPLNSIREGKIFDSGVIVYDAETMWNVALERMKEDNYYFVEKLK